MIKISVVEDEDSASQVLISFLERYQAEKSEELKVTRYSDAGKFLKNYKTGDDIVFMDIELPGMNGMEASRELRKTDKKVVIIFVTNLAQYAVKGYEVEAMDFIVKPVSYFNFSLKLTRAIEKVKAERDVSVLINTNEGTKKIYSTSIRYIEVMKHSLIFHCDDGDFGAYGSLVSIEKELEKTNSFTRCNNCYLVNLRFADFIQGYDLYIGKDKIAISHPKKAEFVKALNNYLGKGMDV